MVIVYIFGIFLALLSTSLFNIVPVLQKEILDKIKGEKMSDQIKKILCDKKWIFGSILGIIGGIPYIIALQIAGIMVVQPLLNFGFIVLVIAAKKRLNEKPTTKSKIAIGLMIIMPLFIVLGQVSEPILFVSPSNFYVLIAIVCVLSIISVIVAIKIPIFWSVCCGLLYSLGALSGQAVFLTLNFTLPLNDLIDIALDNSIWIIFSLLFNFIAMIVTQVGLQKNEASRFNPIQQTINNTTCIIGGAIIFLQIANSPVFYYFGFFIGVIGIFLLGNYQK